MSIKLRVKLLLSIIIISLLSVGCTKSKVIEDKTTAPTTVESTPSKVEPVPPAVDTTQKPSVPPELQTPGSPQIGDNDSGPLVGDNSYIFPYSQKKMLDEAAVLGLQPELLPYARNEIFARRGYIFSNEKYREYFSNKSWYKPDPNFYSKNLSAIENYNINLIKYFEDQYSINYEVPSPPGKIYKANTEVLFDLNRDGSREKIIYKINNDNNIGELIINNKSMKINFQAPVDSFDIVDIDIKDKFKEILISDYGPSDDYITYYFYFDGTNILSVGKTEGLFEYGISIDGAGKIVAETRASVLQTWFFNKTYQLSKQHKIEEILQELYATDYNVFIKIPFKLYKNRGDSTPTILINEGQTLKIIATDNSEWCLLETTQGTKGWIALDNFTRVRNNGLQANDVFAGLCYAD